MKEFTFPKGYTVHIQGIPCELADETRVLTATDLNLLQSLTMDAPGAERIEGAAKGPTAIGQRRMDVSFPDLLQLMRLAVEVSTSTSGLQSITVEGVAATYKALLDTIATHRIVWPESMLDQPEAERHESL